MSAHHDEIVVGTLVLVNGKHRATVKYLGSTEFSEGIWYGLELEREIGAFGASQRAGHFGVSHDALGSAVFSAHNSPPCAAFSLLPRRPPTVRPLPPPHPVLFAAQVSTRALSWAAHTLLLLASARRLFAARTWRCTTARPRRRRGSPRRCAPLWPRKRRARM